MLHLLPDPLPDAAEISADSEVAARLASLRHALRLVDPYGGGPASDPDSDEAIAAAYCEAPAPRRRCFDNRSGRVIAASAEGLEALLAERAAGRQPNCAATSRLAEEIRLGLEDVARLMLSESAGGPSEDLLPIAL